MNRIEKLKNYPIWIGIGIMIFLMLLLVGGFGFDFGYFPGNQQSIQGTGKLVEKELLIEMVNKVVLKIDAELILSQGDVQKASITAQQNILEVIIVEAKDGELIIRSDYRFRDSKPVKINLELSSLKSLISKGSSKIITKNKMTSQDLFIGLFGSSEVEMELDVKQLMTRISGSGDISYQGIATRHILKISGSGDVQSKNLKTRNTDVSISGSGDVDLYADNNLDVRISGSGDVVYMGDAEVSAKISGSGSVNKRKF
ncbi:MAG: DUF2807 domain-containing protein [Proteobacteria bacterium]|nr:DUF2807 domain-containing protein [Pseudomonadota bacterium]